MNTYRFPFDIEAEINKANAVYLGVKAPITYRPPVDRICPGCGTKHTGPFSMCSTCKSAFDRGQ